MQNDLFKQDELTVYKKLSDISFCKQLIKYGLDFMSDYLNMDLEEDHLKIARGIVQTTDRFNKKLTNHIDKDDPSFLRMWKVCSNRHLIRKKKSIWEEMVKRKQIEDTDDNKVLFDIVYDASGKLYGWEV